MSSIKIFGIFGGKVEKGQQEEDFEKLVQKMRAIESGMSSFKKHLQNIQKSIDGLSLLIGQFSSVFPQIFDSSSPFYDFTQRYASANMEVKTLLNNFSSTTVKLLARTTEWNSLFNQINLALKDREEKKKNYEHYETKMEKFVATFEKGKKIDVEQYERNEDKFKKSALDYTFSTEATVKKINEILGRRYDLINPIMMDLVLSEISCIKGISEKINVFENVEDKLNFKSNNLNYVYDTKNYDPLKGRKSKVLAAKSLYLKAQIGGTGNSTNKDAEDTRVFILQNIHKNRSTFPDPDPIFLSAFYKITDDLE